MWPLLLAGLTLLVFTLPLMPAIIEWQRRSDIRPLAIDPDHTLDVAAVAAEFRAMVTRLKDFPAQADMDGATTSLGPISHVNGRFALDTTDTGAGQCHQTLVASDVLALPNSYTFTKAIYAHDGLLTGQDNVLESLMSDGVIVLGHGSALRRWAHARCLKIEPECSLQGPVCAQHAILVNGDCSFTSLRAPVIRFGGPALATADDGDGPGDPAPQTHTNAVQPLTPGDARDGRWFVTRDLTLPPGGSYEGDLIVHGSLWIGTGTQIVGSVKASGRITVAPRVRIDGALIAGGGIAIGGCSRITGPVAGEREIEVGPDCVFGSPARPTTVVASVLRVYPGTVAHGSVCALEDGRAIAPCVQPLINEPTP
ncbi:hypothetical protein QTN24_14345 [Cupriavidus sp. SZY C1]|uniref:hypothetical protein n=1 Tax=Cupriavidus sp. SZY C1 TaxID=3055037 RepID=UPI0028B9B1BF|nr:hypothetical protein [Cupriavidus sp. SZY C1]MDT6962682.1 hypothetical protein [Cupriavidus sp. SZY C1]